MSAIKFYSCVSRRPFFHLGFCTFQMQMGFLLEPQPVSLNHVRRFNQCYLHTARKIAAIWTTALQTPLIAEILFANQCKVGKLDMVVMDKKIPHIAESITISRTEKRQFAGCLINTTLACGIGIKLNFEGTLLQWFLTFFLLAVILSRHWPTNDTSD